MLRRAPLFSEVAVIALRPSSSRVEAGANARESPVPPACVQTYLTLEFTIYNGSRAAGRGGRRFVGSSAEPQCDIRMPNCVIP